MATSPSNKLVSKPKLATGVIEVNKLLEGNATLSPRSANLAVTAVMLEKLKNTTRTDEDRTKMYVFDKDGNKVIL